MKRALIIGLVLVAFCSGLRGETPPKDTVTLTTAEKIYGLSVLWKEVSYNFAYFDQVPELDWDSTYRTFIPRVIDAASRYEYYRELERLFGLLQDGHTNIYLPPDIREQLTYPKLLQAEIDHRMYIRNVDSGLVDRIPIGSEVIEIDGLPAIDYVREYVMPFQASSTEHVLWDKSIRGALKRFKGDSVSLAYLTPDGQERFIKLECNRDGVRWYRPFASRPLLEFNWMDDSLAYVALNSFGDTSIVSRFREILPDLYNARGVIIDLRDNGGGNSGNGTDILQYFTRDTLHGSTWRSPEHVAAYKAWGKYYYDNDLESKNIPYYTGDAWHHGGDWIVVPDSSRKIEVPVAVLIGRGTASAAEDFLIFADSLEQFTYIGEPTFGSTGQPLIVDNLPGGGAARICTKRDTYPDGRDFVGHGVKPDIFVPRSVHTLINNADPVLDKAVDLFHTDMSGNP